MNKCVKCGKEFQESFPSWWLESLDTCPACHLERQLKSIRKITDEEITDYIADWFPEVDRCYLDIMEDKILKGVQNGL